jgi:hypothetical protein
MTVYLAVRPNARPISTGSCIRVATARLAQTVEESRRGEFAGRLLSKIDRHTMPTHAGSPGLRRLIVEISATKIIRHRQECRQAIPLPRHRYPILFMTVMNSPILAAIENRACHGRESREIREAVDSLWVLRGHARRS